MNERSDFDPDFPRVMKLAAERAGSQLALAKALGWNAGSMRSVLAGRERISAYRAARLYEYVGLNEDAGIAAALYLQSRSQDEKEFWEKKFATLMIDTKLRMKALEEKAEATFKYIGDAWGGNAEGEGLEVFMGGRPAAKK